MTQLSEPNNLRADAVASRRAISQAAAKLYGEGGIDVPFEDIAREAGVGKSTLYRHFPAREDLFAAILDDLMEDFERHAASMEPSPSMFLTLFDDLIDLSMNHPAVLAMLPKPAIPTEASQARRARLLALFDGPLEEAQAAGIVRADLRPDDVRILFVMLCAVVRPDMADSDRARARSLAHRSMVA